MYANLNLQNVDYRCFKLIAFTIHIYLYLHKPRPINENIKEACFTTGPGILNSNNTVIKPNKLHKMCYFLAFLNCWYRLHDKDTLNEIGKAYDMLLSIYIQYIKSFYTSMNAGHYTTYNHECSRNHINYSKNIRKVHLEFVLKEKKEKRETILNASTMHGFIFRRSFIWWTMANNSNCPFSLYLVSWS